MRCCVGHSLINATVEPKQHSNVHNRYTFCLICSRGGSPPKFSEFAMLCLIVTCNVLPVMMIFIVFLSVFGVGFVV